MQQINREDKSQYTYLFKCVLVGASGAGKSCLLNQFINGNFITEERTTEGESCVSKSIQFKNKVVLLQVWDIGGHKDYRRLALSHIINSIGIILVYDTTNRNSFQSMKVWLKETKKYNHGKATIMIIGNKADLKQRREISTSESRQYANEQKVIYFECSAKNNEQMIFTKLARDVMQKLRKCEVKADYSSLGIKQGNLKEERRRRKFSGL